jgi:hypothetical protein
MDNSHLSKRPLDLDNNAKYEWVKILPLTWKMVHIKRKKKNPMYVSYLSLKGNSPAQAPK